MCSSNHQSPLSGGIFHSMQCTGGMEAEGKWEMVISNQHHSGPSLTHNVLSFTGGARFLLLS